MVESDGARTACLLRTVCQLVATYPVSDRGSNRHLGRAVCVCMCVCVVRVSDGDDDEAHNTFLWQS